MTTIDPTRTALVAVHVQNDIVGPDGAFAPFFRAEIDRVGTLATAARLLDAARAAGVPVVYTRVAWRPDYSDLHANSPLLNIVVQQNCLVDDPYALGGEISVGGGRSGRATPAGWRSR